MSAPNTKYFVMETLANRVEKRMKELGWTQSDLARRVGHGVKPQNIQQLLDGTVKQPRYIAELAAALGVSVDWLLTGRVTSKPVKGNMHELTSEQVLLLHRFEALTEEEQHSLLEELFRRRSEHLR